MITHVSCLELCRKNGHSLGLGEVRAHPLLPQSFRPEAWCPFRCWHHGKGLLPLLTNKPVFCNQSKNVGREAQGAGAPIRGSRHVIKGSQGCHHPSMPRTRSCSFVICTPHPAKIMDHFGGRVGAQKDPSSAKWPSPARWDPGSLRGYAVAVGPDGRESGEAGYGLQGDHQDLKTKKRW